MDNFSAKLIKKWEENFEKKLEKPDEKAKKEGKLVGRYIRESIADGYAFYKIIKESKNTVEIKHIKGIGDDYMINYWGKQATIQKNYAKENIGFRDRLNSIFS